MLNTNPKIVSENFCNQLNINQLDLISKITDIFSSTDFDDYESIKESVKEIKALLDQSIGNAKLLDIIAKSMGLKNNHILRQSISSKHEIPNYAYEMMSSKYKNKETSDDAIKKLNNIAKYSGAEGLLPQNLPDDVLMNCSIQYQNFRDQNGDTTISLLLLATLIIFSGDKSTYDTNFTVETPKEDMFNYIELYGINILLEEMRRIGVISIKTRDLPNVKNFFDMKRRRKITILNQEAFDSYSS